MLVVGFPVIVNGCTNILWQDDYRICCFTDFYPVELYEVFDKPFVWNKLVLVQVNNCGNKVLSVLKGLGDILGKR